MASKTHPAAPKLEFGITSYMLTSFCTVLASILEGLGVDFVPLGVHLGSNLAPKSDPEPPKSSPGAPKSCPRQPKSFPKADQDCQELPRTRPGLVQDLPRSAPEPTHYPRLEKNSQLHHAILQNFIPNHKTAKFLDNEYPQLAVYPKSKLQTKL